MNNLHIKSYSSNKVLLFSYKSLLILQNKPIHSDTFLGSACNLNLIATRASTKRRIASLSYNLLHSLFSKKQLDKECNFSHQLLV